MNKKTLFAKVIYKGVSGAILGIIAGLLLGLLIWGLEAIVMSVRMAVAANIYPITMIPIEVVTMLGMSFGALIGSLSGAGTALVEEMKLSKKK